MFTERYMRSPVVQPGNNYKGYEAADATDVLKQLKHVHFMLIHGTADRTVPLQHSMMVAKALTDENIMFQQIVSFYAG